MLDRSYVAENDAARERLRAVVSGLTDREMAQSLGDGWTIAARLCHLAFWDRLWLDKFEEWDRAGRLIVPTSSPPPVDADRINGAMLPWWLAVSFDQVRRDVVAAAEAIDHRVATVCDPVAEQVLAARPRTIVRAIHRREHLDEIERALGRG